MPKLNEQNCHLFQFETLQYYQSKDHAVIQLPDQYPLSFAMQAFGHTNLICKIDENSALIVLTGKMLPRIVKWNHLITAHGKGMDCLEMTIGRHFWHSNLRREVRELVSNCDVCKRMKKNGS